MVALSGISTVRLKWCEMSGQTHFDDFPPIHLEGIRRIIELDARHDLNEQIRQATDEQLDLIGNL